MTRSRRILYVLLVLAVTVAARGEEPIIHFVVKSQSIETSASYYGDHHIESTVPYTYDPSIQFRQLPADATRSNCENGDPAKDGGAAAARFRIEMGQNVCAIYGQADARAARITGQSGNGTFGETQTLSVVEFTVDVPCSVTVSAITSATCNFPVPGAFGSAGAASGGVILDQTGPNPADNVQLAQFVSDINNPSSVAGGSKMVSCIPGLTYQLHGGIALGSALNSDSHTQDATAVSAGYAANLQVVPGVVQALAPMVVLHSQERFFPADAQWFIDHSELRFSNGDFKPFHYTPPTLCASLGNVGAERLGASGKNPYGVRRSGATSGGYFADQLTRPHQGGPRYGLPLDEGFFLQLGGDSSDNDTTAMLRRGFPSTTQGIYASTAPVYYEYQRERFLTFYFFYAYDEYRTYVPLVSKPGQGDRQQYHEGDWERISIRLNINDIPVGVNYFRHSDPFPGTYVSWGQVDKANGNHPVVYSGLGTHGSYPKPGDHRLKLPVPLPVYDATESLNDGRKWDTSLAALVDARKQPWYGFLGAWGHAWGTPLDGALGLKFPGDFTGPLGPSVTKANDAKIPWLNVSQPPNPAERPGLARYYSPFTTHDPANAATGDLVGARVLRETPLRDSEGTPLYKEYDTTVWDEKNVKHDVGPGAITVETGPNHHLRIQRQPFAVDPWGRPMVYVFGGDGSEAIWRAGGAEITSHFSGFIYVSDLDLTNVSAPATAALARFLRTVGTRPRYPTEVTGSMGAVLRRHVVRRFTIVPTKIAGFHTTSDSPPQKAHGLYDYGLMHGFLEPFCYATFNVLGRSLPSEMRGAPPSGGAEPGVVGAILMRDSLRPANAPQAPTILGTDILWDVPSTVEGTLYFRLCIVDFSGGYNRPRIPVALWIAEPNLE